MTQVVFTHVPRLGDWANLGECRDLKDPTMFFEQASTAALRFCAICPVRQPCLEHALRYEHFGVWGGMTERGRRAERKRRKSLSLRSVA